MSPRLSELFLNSQSDERLVALARAGHERAFAAIVERYRPELSALARRLCADGRGEDVVQQAFLSAFAALRSGAEVKHVRGWLYRIVRNAAYRSRLPQDAPLDGETASAETVEDVVQQRALAMSALTELARLPARQRQAMVGTVGGMARSEVASTMGLSEGAVRQLVHRARSSLRTAVTAVTPWPVARWFAGLGQSAPGAVEFVAGAGAASSGGIMLKLGALVASGTLATGVAAVDLHGAQPHRAAPRAASPGHSRASTQRAASVALAATAASSAVASGSSLPPAGARIVDASRRAGHAGASVVRVDLHRGRHAPGGEDGSTTTRHDGSGDDDGGGSGGQDRGGSGGQDGGSVVRQGSDREDAGRRDGGHGSGGSGSAVSSTAKSGSSGPGAGGGRGGSGSPSVAVADASVGLDHDGQSLSGSRSGGDGSGSGGGSDGGGTSGSGSGGGSGSGSGGSSGSGSDDGGTSGH